MQQRLATQNYICQKAKDGFRRLVAVKTYQTTARMYQTVAPMKVCSVLIVRMSRQFLREKLGRGVISMTFFVVRILT